MPCNHVILKYTGQVHCAIHHIIRQFAIKYIDEYGFMNMKICYYGESKVRSLFSKAYSCVWIIYLQQ